MNLIKGTRWANVKREDNEFQIRDPAKHTQLQHSRTRFPGKPLWTPELWRSRSSKSNKLCNRVSSGVVLLSLSHLEEASLSPLWRKPDDWHLQGISKLWVEDKGPDTMWRYLGASNVCETQRSMEASISVLSSQSASVYSIWTLWEYLWPYEMVLPYIDKDGSQVDHYHMSVPFKSAATHTFAFQIDEM